MAALETACRDLNFESLLQQKADDAISQLDSGTYRALLVDLTTPGAARFCHEARARRALFNVPLIALSPKLTDLAFSNALRWGADDVVMLGAAEPLAARLQSIPEKVAPITAATRGEAVIADPERSRCDVLGRVLANAGFNVKYATDTVATRFYLTKDSVRLFVLNTELGDPGELIRDARAGGNSADWVVTTKTLDVDGIRSKLKGTPNVVVMSSHGPPENVLFALNLLRPTAEAQKRAEVRALYGAIVLFRPVGLDRDEFGFTYSVSSRGLYLRTLLEPTSERLWVEMTPPNVPRRVKLLAEVAWSRTFGQAGAETAPPGFGVRILDGLGDDLELWRMGFESLEVATPGGGVHEVSTSASSAFRVPLPSNRPPKQPGRPSMASIQVPRLSQTPKPATTAKSGKQRSVLPPSQISMLPGAAGATLSQKSEAPIPQRVDTSRQSRVPERPIVAHRSVRPKPTPSRLPGEAVVTPLAVRAVDVPSSTWASESESQRQPAPRPPSVSSQDAVLNAIRASLPPEGIAAVDQQRARSLAARPPVATPTSKDASTSGENTIVELPVPPSVTEARAQPPTDEAEPVPRLSQTAITEPIDPRIDFDDDPPPRGEPPVGPKHVRTVIGIGNPDMPLPVDWATGHAPAPQAPPMTLADLEPDDVPQDATSTDDEQPLQEPEPAPAPPPVEPVSVSPSEGHTSLLRDDDVESLPPQPAEPPALAEAIPDTPPAQPVETRPRTAPPPRRRRATNPEMATSTETREEDPTTSPSHRRRRRGNSVRTALVAAAVTLGALLLGPRVYERLRAGAASSSGREDTHQPPSQISATRQGEPVATRGLSPMQTGQTTLPAATLTPPERVANDAPTASTASPEELPTSTMRGDEVVPGAEVATTSPTEDEAVPTPPPRDEPGPANDVPDLEELGEDQAYLFVHSTVNANVYVHGVEVGKTNTWLTSRCGFRFIRLGSAPGKWLSKGEPAKLNCRQPNELTLGSTE